jgi:hypothetical protein
MEVYTNLEQKSSDLIPQDESQLSDENLSIAENKKTKYKTIYKYINSKHYKALTAKKQKLCLDLQLKAIIASPDSISRFSNRYVVEHYNINKDNFDKARNHLLSHKAFQSLEIKQKVNRNIIAVHPANLKNPRLSKGTRDEFQRIMHFLEPLTHDEFVQWLENKLNVLKENRTTEKLIDNKISQQEQQSLTNQRVVDDHEILKIETDIQPKDLNHKQVYLSASLDFCATLASGSFPATLLNCMNQVQVGLALNRCGFFAAPSNSQKHAWNKFKALANKGLSKREWEFLKIYLDELYGFEGRFNYLTSITGKKYADLYNTAAESKQNGEDSFAKVIVGAWYNKHKRALSYDGVGIMMRSKQVCLDPDDANDFEVLRKILPENVIAQRKVSNGHGHFILLDSKGQLDGIRKLGKKIDVKRLHSHVTVWLPNNQYEFLSGDLLNLVELPDNFVETYFADAKPKTKEQEDLEFFETDFPQLEKIFDAELEKHAQMVKCGLLESIEAREFASRELEKKSLEFGHSFNFLPEYFPEYEPKMVDKSEIIQVKYESKYKIGSVPLNHASRHLISAYKGETVFKLDIKNGNRNEHQFHLGRSLRALGYDSTSIEKLLTFCDNQIKPLGERETEHIKKSTTKTKDLNSFSRFYPLSSKII